MSGPFLERMAAKIYLTLSILLIALGLINFGHYLILFGRGIERLEDWVSLVFGQGKVATFYEINIFIICLLLGIGFFWCNRVIKKSSNWNEVKRFVFINLGSFLLVMLILFLNHQPDRNSSFVNASRMILDPLHNLGNNKGYWAVKLELLTFSLLLLMMAMFLISIVRIILKSRLFSAEEVGLIDEEVP